MRKSDNYMGIDENFSFFALFFSKQGLIFAKNEIYSHTETTERSHDEKNPFLCDH